MDEQNKLKSNYLKLKENSKILLSKLNSRFGNKKTLQILSALIAVILIILVGAYIHLKTDFKVSDIPEFFRTLDFDIYLILILNLFALSQVFNFGYLITKLSKLRVQDSRIWNKYTVLSVNILFVIITLVILYFAYVIKHPDYSYTYPVTEAHLENYDRPVEVKFNVPVKISKLKASVVPYINGKWEWEPYMGFETLTRKGKFIIEETPMPGERFVGYVAGINKITDNKEHEYGFIFYSVPVPKIIEAYPDKDETDIPVNPSFEFTFDRDYEDLIEVQYSISPEVALENTTRDSNKIEFKPISNLNQNAEYTIKLRMRSKSVNLKSKATISFSEEWTEEIYKFKTPREPLVSEVTPSGDQVRSDSPINIKFEAKMDEGSFAQNYRIEPVAEVDIEWTDNLLVKLTPKEPLAKDTTYKLIIPKGTTSLSGGILQSDFIHEFKTIGKTRATLEGPLNGSSHVNEFSEIHIQFNQEVDKQSVAERLYIDPGLPGEITWIENKLLYKPSVKLNLDTQYTVKVGSGVKSLYGIDSDEEFVFGFRTRSDIYSFNIPIYYQQTGFSCNIYTAIMSLAWKGIYADAVSLIAEIGYNDTRSGDNWVGNPYREYVGTSDGGWGYGTYWPTIKAILANRGVSTSERVGWDISSLTQTVSEGHPVIVWRYNGVGGGQNISWTAWDGTYVNAFNGMHGSVVTGFKGPANDPTEIYIHDPWLGRLWLDRWTFDAYWAYSGRMALIVY